MGIIIRQSIKSSAIAYLGVLIGYINVLWLYTYFLDTEQVGLFRLIQSSAYLLATFGQFGLAQSFIRFYPEHKSQKGYLPVALIGGTIGFLLLCGFSLLFQKQIAGYFAQESPLFVEFFQLTLLISYLIILYQLLEAYSRSLLNIVVPTILKDVGLRLSTMLLLIIYGVSYISFTTLIHSLLLVYGLAVIGLLVHFASNKQLSISLDFSFLKKGQWKRILNYGLFSLIGAGGTQIILQIDSVMISGSLGLDETGIYTIAFFIGVVIEMPKRAITQLSAPLLARSFNKNDMQAVEKLYKQTSINQMIIGALLLIGIWSNINNIYSFIPNNEAYLGGLSVVLFIGLGKLSDMIFGTNGEIIVMSRYFRFNVIAVAFLAVITVLLNLWLIPQYGIEGAAIASFVAMLSFNLVKYVFVWVKFGIQPFGISTLKMLLIIGIVLLINFWLPVLNSHLVDLILRSAIISFSLLSLVVILKISEEVNQLFYTAFKKLKR
ncbi:lipopolysaccharide biosynthesis protein [Roseivirga sp.]|uniref:lipopolysaccharide biosynthesis protein n=1 Tax=Roseivirga sp. TaxID=1964215 RepID=UPI003B52E48E